MAAVPFGIVFKYLQTFTITIIIKEVHGLYRKNIKYKKVER